MHSGIGWQSVMLSCLQQQWCTTGSSKGISIEREMLAWCKDSKGAVQRMRLANVNPPRERYVPTLRELLSLAIHYLLNGILIFSDSSPNACSSIFSIVATHSYCFLNDSQQW
jgi:hypothetical protein